MLIDISKNEIELIDKALTCWEAEATQGALMSSMFGMIISPKDAKEECKSKVDMEMKAADHERTIRRRTATMFRAKLFQAESRSSEHEVDAERSILDHP